MPTIRPTIYKTFTWSINNKIDSVRLNRGIEGEFKTREEAQADFEVWQKQ